MASIIRQWKDEQSGRELVEYQSGTIKDAHSGKLVQGPASAKITNENQREMQQKRKEAAARKIRDEIATRSGRGGRPIEAVALAAGDLWEQIVINPEANARYRLETWQTIGRHAGILGDQRENSAQDGVTIQIGPDLARQMVDAILKSRLNE